MDKFNKIDDSLIKKDYVRALVLVVLIGIGTVWFSFRDDSVEHKKEIDALNAAHRKQIYDLNLACNAINAAWDKKYQALVDARNNDKDETIRKLEEKDENHRKEIDGYLRSTQRNRVKAESNENKSKVIEKTIHPKP